ncbi:MAG: nucleotidyltransferase family protein [Bacteroidales bacterium]|nr:nucleotidyltransferase family protein [Bacteroidales bacterium]
MLSKNEILEKLRELKPILSEEYAVKEIGIFGSFAQNEASDESDIDVLVELHRPIGWEFFTLQMYLEEIFGRKVDLVTKNALKEQIKESILTQVNYA